MQAFLPRWRSHDRTEKVVWFSETPASQAEQQHEHHWQDSGLDRLLAMLGLTCNAWYFILVDQSPPWAFREPQ